MKTRFVVLSLAALLALPLIACSSADSTEPGPGDDTEELDPEGKADGVNKPVGTYEALNAPMGSVDFSRLVLKTDGSVHVEYAPQCETCKSGAFDGTYKFTKSTTSSRRYIRMELPNETVRYEYKIKNGKLNLRHVESSDWFYMSKAEDAWCAEAAECKIQNLPQPRCPGKWECEASACHYDEDCSGPTNDCEEAGGSCVGLTPNGCVNGTVGNANEYSCGGQVGVMCCLPAPSDCRSTGCASGKYCTFCWTGYACIPEGAVC